jgi:hypothetical protein
VTSLVVWAVVVVQGLVAALVLLAGLREVVGAMIGATPFIDLRVVFFGYFTVVGALGVVGLCRLSRRRRFGRRLTLLHLIAVVPTLFVFPAGEGAGFYTAWMPLATTLASIVILLVPPAREVTPW